MGFVKTERKILVVYSIVPVFDKFICGSQNQTMESGKTNSGTKAARAVKTPRTVMKERTIMDRNAKRTGPEEWNFSDKELLLVTSLMGHVLSDYTITHDLTQTGKFTVSELIRLRDKCNRLEFKLKTFVQ